MTKPDETPQCPHQIFARHVGWPKIAGEAGEDTSILPLYLSSKNVDVWSVSLEVACSHIETLHRVLDIEELERASRFHFENDANRFIVCRAILRMLLGSYTQTPARELAFTYNAHGKPQARGTPGDENELHFNVSHAGNYAVFAFAQNPVGVDIEYSMSTIGMDEIAAQCLTRYELENWRELPEPQQRRRFFEIWTAKEAYLKMLGCGLSTPMNQLHLSLEDAPAKADSSLYF